MPANRIGLSMIVKDEAHVIARCLASVRPLIDHWVIVDTGSTDDTVRVIEETMTGIPGFVVHRPFVDFGHSRSEALALARPHADYTLVMDADDVLEISTLPERPLTADAYMLEVLDHGTSYKRMQLFDNALPWRYEGAVHEFAKCEGRENPERAVLEGVSYRRLGGGARSLRTGKFLRDAAILERALEKDPTNARNAFYLGQSYYDAGDFENALAAYRRRVELGGWAEEVWFSLHRIAKCLEALLAPPAEITAAYLHAFQYRPVRAESPCELARFYRERKQPHIALLLARAAAALPKPSDILFVDDAVYDWRAAHELAMATAQVAAMRA